MHNSFSIIKKPSQLRDGFFVFRPAAIFFPFFISFYPIKTYLCNKLNVNDE